MLRYYRNCRNFEIIDVVHTSIPDGLKNNVYFILDGKKNLEWKSYGKPPEFFDDCGAWDREGKGAPTTYYHVKGEIVSLLAFNKSRHLYYTCKGLQIYPQHHPYEILIVKRCYLKLKADNNNGRRITRILEAKLKYLSQRIENKHKITVLGRQLFI